MDGFRLQAHGCLTGLLHNAPVVHACTLECSRCFEMPWPAADKPVTSLLTDAPNSASAPVGSTASGSVLDNANVPTGTTASVTGFSLAGSPQVYVASKTPIVLKDPISGDAIGTLVVAPDGAFDFTPTSASAGGTTLAVNVYVAATDKQTATSALALTALPGGNARAHRAAEPGHGFRSTCTATQGVPMPGHAVHYESYIDLHWGDVVAYGSHRGVAVASLCQA